MKRQKQIKENVPFGVNRDGKPFFSVRPLGPVDVNNDASLRFGYEQKRAQRREMLDQYSYMIGTLDNADKMFVDLFQKITDIRNFIGKQQEWPLITKRQSHTLKEINKKLDNCNKIIIAEILPLIDELGTDSQQGAKS